MDTDLTAGLPQLPPFHWDVDPARFALDRASRRRVLPRLPPRATPHRSAVDWDRWREDHAPVTGTAACTEVGRRLLMGQLTWGSWILRRVEKVSFISDRRLLRASTIELRVPEFLPTVMAHGEPHHLVPLTLMRRRTLVNLDLADDNGSSLSLLGLRFTQQLDQSMLWAAGGRDGLGPELDPFDGYVSDAVSGEAGDVRAAYARFSRSFADARDRDSETRDDLTLLEATLDRLWHNFTLYVTVPAARDRHRRVRLAFEERMRWEHQLPSTHEDADGTFHYVPMVDSVHGWKTLGQSFASRPTRLRFLTPGADACASYHFEFKAPTGISVDRADLVAGRPNTVVGEPPRVSCDSVSDPGHSAGLHAVEVPPGSLCRAQVDLRLPRRGWLSTLLGSMVAVSCVMIAVLVYAHQVANSGVELDTDQATNVIVLLVSVAAGAATYVAQQHATDVMTRLAKALRLVAVAAVAAPAMAAVTITLIWQTADSNPQLLFRVLSVVTCVELAALGVAVYVWLSILKSESNAAGRPSPWDMTHVSLPDDPRCTPKFRRNAVTDSSTSLADATFEQCCREVGMKEPAVGVYSAEGWLEHYRWSNRSQALAVQRLEAWQHGPGSCPVHPHRPRQAPTRADAAPIPDPGAR